MSEQPSKTEQPDVNTGLSNGTIPARETTKAWYDVGFAAFWNILTLGIIFLYAIPAVLERNRFALFLFLLILIGVWLLYQSYKKIHPWLKFGKGTLQMDPFPGSLGGDIGGKINLNWKYRTLSKVEVSVLCIRTQLSESDFGPVNNEDIIWRTSGETYLQSSTDGSEIQFRFSVPEDLPASSETGNEFYTWVIRIYSAQPGEDLYRTFIIPVCQTNTPSRSEKVNGYTLSHLPLLAIPEKTAQINFTPERLQIYYPMSRNFRFGITLMILSVLAICGSTYLGFEALANADGTGLWQQLFNTTTGLIFFIFTLFTCAILIITIYQLSNTLRSDITSDGIEVIRRVIVFKFVKYVRRNEIASLESKATKQIIPHRNARVRRSLHIKTKNGRKITIADGLNNSNEADQLKNLVGEACHISN